MVNGDVLRTEMKKAGVLQWQVAKEVGYSEGWFNKKLRYDFSDEEANMVRDAIRALQK